MEAAELLDEELMDEFQVRGDDPGLRTLVETERKEKCMKKKVSKTKKYSKSFSYKHMPRTCYMIYIGIKSKYNFDLRCVDEL